MASPRLPAARSAFAEALALWQRLGERFDDGDVRNNLMPRGADRRRWPVTSRPSPVSPSAGG